MLRSPLGWWSSITQVSRWQQPLFSNHTDSLFIPNSLDGRAAAIGGTYPPTLGQIEAVEFLVKRAIHLRLCACVTIWPTLASSLTTLGRQTKKTNNKKQVKKRDMKKYWAGGCQQPNFERPHWRPSHTLLSCHPCDPADALDPQVRLEKWKWCFSQLMLWIFK